MPEAVHEIRAEVARRGHREAEWRVGGSATPADLADRLQAHGFAPSSDPHLASMILTREPAAVDGVETRRVRDLEDLAAAARIIDAAFGHQHVPPTDADLDGERSGNRPRVYVGLVDGRPVGAARALFDDDCPGVLLLAGGVLPEARGRGAYRALVRMRWDDALAAGMGALVVQAGTMSRPILERLGFETVAEHDVLVDPATC